MDRSRLPRLLMWLAGLAVVALVLLWKGSEGPEAGRAGSAAETPDGTPPALVASGDPKAPSGDRPAAPADPAAGEIAPWPVGEIEAAGAPDGRVHVKLVDGAGRPLADHPIEVDWWKAFGVSGAESGRTDAEGRFRTSANEAFEIDSVSIPVAGDAVPHTYHSGPFAAAPDRPDEVVVQLPTTCLIRGRVVDLAGAPRGGEPVVCHARRALAVDPFVHRLGADEQQVETRADGTFEILVLAGHHRVQLLDERGPVVPMHADVHVTRARRVVDVTLLFRRPLEGRPLTIQVTGPGADGEDVRVSAYTDAPVFGVPDQTPGVRYETRRTFFRATRQPEGTFRIDHLPEGAWTIGAHGPGVPYRSVDVPEGAREVRVELEPAPERTRTIEVVGRTPDGRAVRPTVQIYDHGGGWVALPSKGPGTPVSLDRRAEAPVHVAVRQAGFALGGVGPLTARTAPDVVEVQLEPAQEGRVEVVDEAGRPVAAEIRLKPAWALFQTLDGRPPRPGFGPLVFDGHRRVTEDGRARFDGLGAAPYRVLATPADATRPPARGLLRGGETLRLVLGTGLEVLASIPGRIVDAQSGAPLPGVEVSAWTDPEQGEATSAKARSDADGRFVLSGLARQVARLSIRQKGYAHPALRELDVAKTQEPLALRMYRARFLPLQVVDARQRPVRDAAVFVAWSSGEQVALHDQYGSFDEEEVETDANGRVDLRGVPATRVLVMIRGPDEETEQARAHELDLREPVRGLVRLLLD